MLCKPFYATATLAALFLLGSGRCLGHAADDKAAVADKNQEKRIAKLIKDLDHANFETREKAGLELIAIGLPSLPALKKALTEKPSLEVTKRIENIIETVELRQAPDFQLHAEWQVNASSFWISPRGKWIWASSGKIYDVDNKRELALDFKSRNQPIPAFSSDERIWAYCEKPKDHKLRMRLYDRKLDKELTRTVSLPAASKYEPWILAISSGGRYGVISSSTADHEASLYDLSQGKEVAKFPDYKDPYDGSFSTRPFRVRFTPDEKYLLFHSRPENLAAR